LKVFLKAAHVEKCTNVGKGTTCYLYL